ncbi:hypothetical protein GCM10010992_07270 [Cloacibacterium rupense]|uniref:CBM20 domain-containing protein n=1 Tax=Cloacibacterium rupense TaxID=517423 RepID=A0ABQ2NHC2_9FLAO|nr:alpha-amylase family glycosyl hydrolase [Cloacibacterium rupense]GGP02528.1 hypothetical protein GCM10010992_07270 [Cloacibacterium rupense]
MKKILLLLNFLFFSVFYTQTVTTIPAIIPDDYTGVIKVIYNPGSGPMSTATNCYAHIGVKTGGVRWQCAPSWRSGLEKHKMVKNGSNWELTIDNMYSYFSGCAAPFQELDMVFNDGPAGTKEGKTSTGGDFFINISPASQLSVQFSTTSSSGIINAGSTVNLTANTTSTANIVLKKNGATVSSTSGTSITFSETLSVAGDYLYTVEATANGNTVSDTRNITIVSASEDQAKPNGIKEGVTYNSSDPTKLHLCLYAKDKNNVLPDNVFVIGDFNNWTASNAYQLKKDGNTGYWWIELSGIQPGVEYAYQYVVKIGNNTINISDPYATKVLHPNDQWEPSQNYPNLKPYPTKADGNYVAVFQTNKSQYSWSPQTLGFTKPNKNNLVIYEVWVHDFAPNKNLKSIIERLDYIKNLGVNAIELMPIAEFEGNVSWGYNPTHYFALDKAYGSENDLKKLVDEAHKRGIAVIMDMVFNHVTGSAPQAKLYWGTNNTAANNPWFNQMAPHGASVFQDWNHNFGPTRDLLRSALKYWIDEYKVDGYRMDISHGFCGENCSNRTDIVFDYYNNGVKAANNDAYFILEHWEEAPGERQNYINWGMLCWLNNTHSYEQTAMGWLHDGDSLDASNQDGWVTYCESHDEERNMFKAKTYGNGSTLRSTQGYTNRAPLNTAFNVLLNGPHMLWMFQELAYDYSILSNASGAAGNRTDPKPVPETLGWYTNSSRMNSYKKIAQTIQLRTRILPEVFEGNPINSDLGTGKAARSVIWGADDKRVFIVGNFNAPTDGSTYTGNVNVNLPLGNNWYDYFEDSNTALNAGTSIPLQPGELKIYTAKKLPLPVVPVSYDFLSTSNFSKSIDVKVYPTYVTDDLTIDTKETIRYIQLINMNGLTFTPSIINNKVQLGSIPSGMYILHIMLNNGNAKAFKIIKK